MTTASTPCRSWSPCQSSSAAPTCSQAFSASTSSQEPGNWTTPKRITRRSRSPRSACWPATSRRATRAGRGPRCPTRSRAPHAHWPRPRSPAPAARVRRRCPVGPGSRPWGARARAPSRRRALQPGVERLARDQLVALDVARPRALDDLRRHLRSGRRLVPPGARGPVAHVLLVEARLAAAGLIALRRPVARRVRCQHLVADRQLAVVVEPELELRVGEDHAALARAVGG